MITKVQRSIVEGFEVVELANDCLRISVVPELGAKIVSLIHLRTGREWMWKPERNPRYFSVSVETPFDEGPFLGADECSRHGITILIKGCRFIFGQFMNGKCPPKGACHSDQRL